MSMAVKRRRKSIAGHGKAEVETGEVKHRKNWRRNGWMGRVRRIVRDLENFREDWEKEGWELLGEGADAITGSAGAAARAAALQSRAVVEQRDGRAREANGAGRAHDWGFYEGRLDGDGE
ncbi:hypothetical protein AXG93_3818s1350 [Marchantia polymorpha subsp. ruderalis]|uniref:Uncharacterized protein n=1 Tax=Marchantia polymorpha subsp. ruderalis TaxID=1480154 RepID=A0A176VHU3_MARPO|nr:hypothetical protein AXG93_3818s1350 [Marchantia polymorpha subsp. ruderalis]